MEQDGNWGATADMVEYCKLVIDGLDDFKLGMYGKMLRTAHKGSWMEYDFWMIITRVQQEFKELSDAMLAWLHGEGSIEAAIHESVDLGNTAMMVHSWLKRQRTLMERGGLPDAQESPGPECQDRSRSHPAAS